MLPGSRGGYHGGGKEQGWDGKPGLCLCILGLFHSLRLHCLQGRNGSQSGLCQKLFVISVLRDNLQFVHIQPLILNLLQPYHYVTKVNFRTMALIHSQGQNQDRFVIPIMPLLFKRASIQVEIKIVFCLNFFKLEKTTKQNARSLSILIC